MRERARLPSAQGNVIRAIFWPAHVYFIELFMLGTHKVINIRSCITNVFPCFLYATQLYPFNLRHYPRLINTRRHKKSVCECVQSYLWEKSTTEEYKSIMYSISKNGSVSAALHSQMRGHPTVHELEINAKEKKLLCLRNFGVIGVLCLFDKRTSAHQHCCGSWKLFA